MAKTIIEEIERVPTHLSNCLDMLERWGDRLSNELDATKTGHAPNASVARQLSEVTKTSTSMAKEMRAWVGKVKDTVDSMSIEDKLMVSMNLIQELSTGDRHKFYSVLMATERARQDGGIKLAVTHV